MVASLLLLPAEVEDLSGAEDEESIEDHHNTVGDDEPRLNVVNAVGKVFTIVLTVAVQGTPLIIRIIAKPYKEDNDQGDESNDGKGSRDVEKELADVSVMRLDQHAGHENHRNAADGQTGPLLGDTEADDGG